jgi:CRISPR/Cas system-associated endoribonuclease Cas2
MIANLFLISQCVTYEGMPNRRQPLRLVGFLKKLFKKEKTPLIIVRLREFSTNLFYLCTILQKHDF